MSYLQQQQKVQAENEESERQKLEDELELHNEETRKASAADPLKFMNEAITISLPLTATSTFLDEAQQNSTDEERSQNDMDSTITVKKDQSLAFCLIKACYSCSKSNLIPQMFRNSREQVFDQKVSAMLVHLIKMAISSL